MSKQTEWGPDAVEMLRDDHRRVHELFQEFDATTDEHDKKQLAETALLELQIHAALEEELFYPAARAVCENDALLDRAEEEHHIATIGRRQTRTTKRSSSAKPTKQSTTAKHAKQHA